MQHVNAVKLGLGHGVCFFQVGIYIDLELTGDEVAPQTLLPLAVSYWQ